MTKTARMREFFLEKKNLLYVCSKIKDSSRVLIHQEFLFINATSSIHN